MAGSRRAPLIRAPCRPQCAPAKCPSSNPMPLAETAPRSSPAFLLSVYGVTIFLSAALLFAVQPMFTKMVLPRLGGAPSVWSVAMVFFQAALLAGYAYAHLLTRYAPGRMSVVIHLVVMIAACLFLPIAIEPLIRLGDQTRLWSAGFAVLILLIAICGYLLWRMPDHAPAAAADSM